MTVQPPAPDPPAFLTKKEFEDWQKQQKEQQEHEAEPDENFVPTWAKSLDEKVTALTKTTSPPAPPAAPPTPAQPPQQQQVQPPPVIVSPKKEFWPKGWPRIL